MGEQFQPVHARHRDITDDRIVVLRLHPLQRLDSGMSRLYMYPMEMQGEHARKRLKKRWIIINQKDLWGMHTSFSSLHLA